MTRWLWALCCAGWTLCACSRLPDIAANACGNHVLEPGEDCDGFSRDGLACLQPGQNGQCHMDCRPSSTGEATACPNGFGCDAQNVCRKATSGFTALPERVLGNAAALARADFNGDGRDDILSAEPPLQFGVQKVRVHYFDRDGSQSQTWNASLPLLAPHPFAAKGGGRPAHLTFSAGSAVGVMTGEPDGSLLPEAMPTYLVRSAALLIDVSEEPIGGSASWLVLAGIDGKRGLYRQGLDPSGDDAAVVLVQVATLEHGVEDLAAEPVAASFFGQRSCRDAVFAFRGARQLWVYSTCREEPDRVLWRDAATQLELPLDPPAAISAGLLSADIDGDGHADLVVGTEDGPYLAYGTGAGFGPLQPHAFTLRVSSGADAAVLEQGLLSPPIAAGDISGDGRVDLFFPEALVVADAPAAGARAPTYHPVAAPLGPHWTEAQVADFNRDGKLDAVATSAQGLDLQFFNGTGSERVNVFRISTDRPVEQLGFGDMDGDLVNDLVFVQRAPAPDLLDEVSIAFGNPAGPPSAPLRQARLRQVQQVLPFRGDSTNTVTSLAVMSTYSGPDEPVSSALSVLVGTSDRHLPSITELTSFSEDQSLVTNFPITLTAGHFREPGAPDVVALAAKENEPDSDPALWLLSDIDGQRGVPVKLGWGLPRPSVRPVHDQAPAAPPGATLTAGDLDGDGVDELLLALLSESRTQCILGVAHVGADGGQRLETSTPIVLDEPCADATELATADLDGDGQRDVVLLYGTPGTSRRWVTVFGNGSRELDPGAIAQLSPAGEALAFSVLPGPGGVRSQIAYVTESEVRMLQAPAAARDFEDTGAITSLERGSGISAADINGDGLWDLVVTDRGTLRVLLASVEGP